MYNFGVAITIATMPKIVLVLAGCRDGARPASTVAAIGGWCGGCGCRDVACRVSTVTAILSD